MIYEVCPKCNCSLNYDYESKNGFIIVYCKKCGWKREDKKLTFVFLKSNGNEVKKDSTK